MPAPETLEASMLRLWARAAARCVEFDLVLPRSPAFVCQASACPAHCCKVFTVVPLGECEVIRLARASGLAPLEVIACDEGEPLTHPSFPKERPYFLARRGGVCRFLGPDLLCSQHQGRPDACRVYPHYLFFFDSSNGRAVKAEWPAMRAAVDELMSGRPPTAERRLGALLLAHGGCPGFTGPPLGLDRWRTLVSETFQLQYGDEAGEPTAGSEVAAALPS